jgi:hypothetical protein
MNATEGGKVECPKCGGEVVARELVQVGYEIATDGKGGYEYTGNRLYENGDPFELSEAVCRECDWSLVLTGVKLDDNGVVIDEEES